MRDSELVHADSDLEDFQRRLASQRRERTEAMRLVVDGVRNSDFDLVWDGFIRLEQVDDGWGPALRRVAKLPKPSTKFCCKMANQWRRDGDHFRNSVGDDLLLVGALRVLLPSYRGPRLTLYRGEGSNNRSRRTYGLSWSRSREVAAEFASGRRELYQGGTVLLKADAPREAIIHVVPPDDDNYAEREVVVDRRHLGAVSVMARFLSAEARTGSAKPIGSW